MTWSEKTLWPELRKLDVNFRRQAPIGPYFADFAIYGRKLVIEVDGGVHERLDHVALRDGERQLWLQGQGFRVLRFSDRRVENDLRGVVEEVRQALGMPAETPHGVGADLGVGPNGPLTPPSPTLPPSRRKGE